MPATSDDPGLAVQPRQPWADLSAPSDYALAAFRKISVRFPGAVLLSDQEFNASVVGRSFKHRDVDGGQIWLLSSERFHSPGSYFYFGHRLHESGAYFFNRGIVEIDCRQYFAGLGNKRIFFRQKGRVYTTSADGDADVLELIPQG